jgi:hypothetical protein
MTTHGCHLATQFIAAGGQHLCPMESLRIPRQVTDSSYAGAETGLLTGLPKLIGEEGLGSLFGGVWAICWRNRYVD